ncbi:MAG: glycosyltransferase, partial [Candidatus Aenigmatarchaeota archaeon]
LKDKVKLLNFSYIHKKFTYKKLLNFIIELFKLKRYKKDYKIKITLSLGEPANLFNVLSKLSNEKIILSFHNHYSTDFSLSQFWNKSFVDKIRKVIRINLIKFLYQRADLMVAVSNGVKNDLIKNFGLKEDKIKVIYNPFLISDIKNKASEDIKEFRSIFNHKTIITVGRLSMQKGHWYLLRIFRELKRRINDLKLIIIGDGELKDFLINLSKSLQLKTFVWDRDLVSENFDVYFMGPQANPFKFMAKASLFVLSSLYEGLPSVIIEALACGIPVVSADCKSGPREILAPDTDFAFQTRQVEYAKYGILLPPFDGELKKLSDPLTEEENIWVCSLSEILSQKDLLEYYGKLGLERALDFDASKISKEWNEVFEGILKES